MRMCKWYCGMGVGVNGSNCSTIFHITVMHLMCYIAANYFASSTLFVTYQMVYSRVIEVVDFRCD